jgi:GNAT superfamily N-acetyltransferase/catechol 2,3-dioxygenase-like lactoylglutathione lyase family enzyme
MSSVLDHVDLRVKEMVKAAPFYRGLLPRLGFTEQLDVAGWLQFEARGRGAMEFFGVTEDPLHVPNRTRIAFRVATKEAVDELARLARELGAANIEGPGYEGEIHYAVFFDDPSGNSLEICYRPRSFASDVSIRRATGDPSTVGALAELTMDCVEGGASIGFMSPLSRVRAVAFWEGVFAAAARGERIVLVAENPMLGGIVGTVQLIPATAENQPHRADVAKMQVHRRARRRGVGAMLLRAIEEEARQIGRTLLVLDTVVGSAAARLYTTQGWQRCGEIPNYALLPDGGLCSTQVLYRELLP